MSSNVLVSDMDQGSVHDLQEYSIAKEVIKSHTTIIGVYTKLLPVLYHFAQFQTVWPVIELVEESKLLAEMQLQHYTKVLNSKGLVSAQKTK